MQEEYNKELLEKVQGKEFEILKSTIEICGSIDVDYYLAFGSMLGLVRHGGFIPWDDDIDICMPRADYEKFLREAPKYLPSNMYLQTPYNDAACPYTMSKIRMDDTQFIEYCNRNVKMHQGIYMDIFPIDNVPDDKKEYHCLHKKAKIYTMLFTYRQTPDITKPPESIGQYIKFGVRRTVHLCSKLIPRKLLIRAIDHVEKKYNVCDTIGVSCIDYPYPDRSYIKKSDLFPLIERDFCGIKVKTPNNYDVYLRNLYSDYMKYPPIEERCGHKPYILKV